MFLTLLLTRTVNVVDTAPPVELAVTPATSLSFSGPKGGPYSPTTAPYQVSNTGEQSVEFSVSADKNWVGLSPSSGVLAPNEIQLINISITSRANRLKNGDYSSNLTFINTTNGQGNTNRTVSLTIGGSGGGEPPPPPSSGGLVVTPDTDFSVSGKSGSFGTQATVYKLVNLSDQAITYSVTPTFNEPWVQIIINDDDNAQIDLYTDTLRQAGLPE